MPTFNSEDYIKLLSLVECDIKDVDPNTAYNICREVSLIYIKDRLDIPQPNIISRLNSLIIYIKKALPMEAPNIVNQIDKIIVSMSS